MIQLTKPPKPPHVGDLLWWRGHRFKLDEFKKVWSEEANTAVLDAVFRREREISKYVQSKKSLRCHAGELVWAAKGDWARLSMEEAAVMIRRAEYLEHAPAIMASAQEMTARYVDFGKPGWFLLGTLIPRLKLVAGAGPLVMNLKKREG